jgi:hypothetical protein
MTEPTYKLIANNCLIPALVGQFAFYVLVIIITTSQALYAQYESEALKFSMLQQSGSARFIGMGGAMGALGSEFSCISNNPAGIGFYRNSELTLSPSLYLARNQANYQLQNFEDDKFNFNFGNIGLVYSRRTNRSEKTGLQFLNFAIGYNRINNFNRSLYFEGDDSQYTLADVMVQRSQGLTPSNLDPFSTQLAFNSWLTDTAGVLTNYESLGPNALSNKRMTRLINSRGSIGEIALAGSANFSNKFFIGANISVTTLTYKNTQVYEELDVNNIHPTFNSLAFTENLDVSGLGINLKLGFIYRPLNWFRAGVSIHTPTWYNMNETYVNQMKTSLSFGNFNANSPVGKFEYDLTSPWRFQASAGFIILKHAAIGIEYELVDYSAITLRPATGFFSSANAFIDSSYAITHNIRIGAEVRLDPFRIRGGYQYQMNPFNRNVDIDASVHHVSVGAGFRNRKWFSIDAAYVLSMGGGKQYINREFPALNPAIITYWNHNIVFTLGFHF